MTAIVPIASTRTVARWFGPADAPLLGWLSTVPGRATGSGVLMLPPVGYEWWSGHRTLRTTAERLAALGHTVLRFDYHGTGDSAGTGAEHGRLTAWRASAAAGADLLRGLGCDRLTLVGTRLGGLIALLDGAALAADAVVAWEPPPSGKRFVRELRMLSQPVPDSDGAVGFAGVLFAAETLADISALDLRGLASPPAASVTLLGGGLETTAELLRASGCDVSVEEPAGGEQALAVPTEDATVPGDVVAAIATAVGPADADAIAPPEDGDPVATMPWEDATIIEVVVRLGPDGLVGVLATPADGPGETVVVWLNSGSEPHVGSGRAWVEFSRHLARHGHGSLRLDFSGWGESPDLGHAPGRPYDAHTLAETAQVVSALHERGYERVVLAGLCAGAWIALQAVLDQPVAGVIALNPQLYWRPGDPVEALMSTTRERRAPVRAKEERGGRFGVWTVLDRVGHRPWAGRWLDAVAATEVPVLLAFAEGDDGLEFLHNRLARRLDHVTRTGRVRVVEMPDIDHSMHRLWLRDRVTNQVTAFLDSLA